MAEPRERPLHELLSSRMVDIYVGEENTCWTLHEKLLCHRSRFFRNIFYSKTSKNSRYGLPDESDEAFRRLVGWLYSDYLAPPSEEKDLTYLLDLYLMAEKFEMKKLVLDILEAVRKFYHDNDSWPSLRRTQYIYANTEMESPMRQLLVQCVARMLVLGDGMPAHWERALRNNGQLSVDIILTVQKWHFEPENVPDAREQSVEPIMEEAMERIESKREAEGEEEEEELTNGVEHEDQEEGNGGEEQKEGKKEGAKKEEK
ncbi:hypothetical protein LTR62_007238 [Meristemomyces frigidus]|uniref:BTB domain-containing protein n=1 Tax=Meristemomyces frigidus TaxID=1508187 RepID=A0AAN7YDX7_9PEZI|nr:hypothetical protein LTR62_007238 [Meristemomyces frigidus]